jgi:NCAIR mutase (PurE)-related protein
MPEISDADNELLKLAKETLGGKNRLKQLRLLKEQKPDLSFPELEMDERVNAAVAPIQEENKKLRDDLAKKDLMDGIREKRQNAVKALVNRGYSEEDLSTIEKIMVEKGITTHDAAIEFHDLNTRVAAPSFASAGKSYDTSATVPMVEQFSKGNVDQVARQIAADTISELRGAKKR